MPAAAGYSRGSRFTDGEPHRGWVIMPLHLEPVDVTSELENVASVLIVSCPVCPPISLAAERESPVIEFFKNGFKTGAFEDHIEALRSDLEQRGIQTGVFTSYAPLPTMCLWTQGQRKRLGKRARNYGAVLVLGCTSAAHTARQIVEGTDCRVIEAMRLTGLTNAKMKAEFPMKAVLDETTCLSERGEREAGQPGAA